MTNLVTMARAEADRIGQIGPGLTHRLCDEIEQLRHDLEKAIEGRNGEAREVERLRAALSISRGQWIHSVNAKQCMEALGDSPAEPTAPTGTYFLEHDSFPTAAAIGCFHFWGPQTPKPGGTEKTCTKCGTIRWESSAERTSAGPVDPVD